MAQRDSLENVVRSLDDEKLAQFIRMLLLTDANSRRQIANVAHNHLKRLGKDQDLDLVSDLRVQGEGNFDSRSLLDWMTNIHEGDKRAIAQLQTIHATALLR